jgi:hypothetical protein
MLSRNKYLWIVDTFMGWFDRITLWWAKRKEKRQWNQALQHMSQQDAADHYEPMVQSVLEQFINSDFPDSHIQNTGPGEWELQVSSGTGEIRTDVKIELFFDKDVPSSFLCEYYGVNCMHMQQAALDQAALANAIRKCISS